MKVKVVALDLERTLISDALNKEPRPGLYDFLSFCTLNFERVALFTSVNKEYAYSIIFDLLKQGYIPQEFVDKMEYVQWKGNCKDLIYVSDAEPTEVLLIDDDEGFIKPEQKEQWIAIDEYDPYLVRNDRELSRIRLVLEERLGSCQ